MHAFGAHLPLEKCKKPRTGRGFLRIYRGRADDPFRYIGFSTVWKPRRDIPPGLLLLGKGRGKSRFSVLFSFQKYFTVAQGKEHMLSFFHMAFQQFHGG